MILNTNVWSAISTDLPFVYEYCMSKEHSTNFYGRHVKHVTFRYEDGNGDIDDIQGLKHNDDGDIFDGEYASDSEVESDLILEFGTA